MLKDRLGVRVAGNTWEPSQRGPVPGGDNSLSGQAPRIKSRCYQGLEVLICDCKSAGASNPGKAEVGSGVKSTGSKPF